MSIRVIPNELGREELDDTARRAKSGWDAAAYSELVGMRTKEPVWNVPAAAAAEGDASPAACAAMHAALMADAAAAKTPVRPCDAASEYGSPPPRADGEPLPPVWSTEALRSHLEGKEPAHRPKLPSFAKEKGSHVNAHGASVPEGSLLRSRKGRLLPNPEQRKILRGVQRCLNAAKLELVRFVNAARDESACTLYRCW